MEHLEDRIAEWKRQVNHDQKAHYALAIKHKRYHYWMGIAATLITVLAAVSLLAGTVHPDLRNLLGTLTLLAALICVVQTFFSQARLAERHRAATSRLVLARRDIEMLEKFRPSRKSERDQRVSAIEDRISAEDVEIPDLRGELRSGGRFGILPVLGAAVLLIVVIAAGYEWARQIPATQQSAVYGVRESVQQGVERWPFDAGDPLLRERTILINTFINELTTQKVVTSLAYLTERDQQAPISLYLSSTGGYVKDAYAIVNAIHESGAIVDTVAIGDCFSACAKILMGGSGVRSIHSDARVMIHTHYYPYDDDPRSDSRILYDREREFIRQHSDLPLDWIDRNENFFYLTPEQALDYQIIDEIRE
jgi:ATP-dependent protease ClpP protease subunit